MKIKPTFAEKNKIIHGEKLKMTLLEMSETPISFHYKKPSDEQINLIKMQSDLTVLQTQPGLCLDQSYFKAGHEGCSRVTFTRQAVAKRLEIALEFLSPKYGLIILDAYRSIQAQRALFAHMASGIENQNPSWTPDQVFQETRKYMVHPDEKSRFAIPPHNSGGAIDLALQINGRMLEFGSAFDDPSIVSSTRFFEAEYDKNFGFTPDEWIDFRQNRRVLFHTMIELGFTNYRDEWWHYDLGDCMWAEEFNIPWVFDSMESEVKLYAGNV